MYEYYHSCTYVNLKFSAFSPNSTTGMSSRTSFFPSSVQPVHTILKSPRATP